VKIFLAWRADAHVSNQDIRTHVVTILFIHTAARFFPGGFVDEAGLFNAATASHPP
jgi:hypothetical protein